MDYLKSEPKLVTIILVILVISLGVYIFGRYQRDVQQANHVAYCVGGYTGESNPNNDWSRLIKLPTDQISRETGIRETVINDCLGRPQR